ncbi:hypothetical protein HK101_009909 [Irineochytrium annulatum]|nr:hypothetical protein HK101_009909 [Irineochytrium annulatum]
MKEDSEVLQVAGDAATAMSIASELFLEHFCGVVWERTYKDGRKIVAYKDVDIVPPTVQLKKAVQKKAKVAEALENGEMPDETLPDAQEAEQEDLDSDA